MRLFVAGAAACALLAFAAAALGARAFADASGDNNAAPDVTNVSLAQSAGTLTVTVAVQNYAALPNNSWFNLWFDLDNNVSTGDEAGDEALIRYLNNGTVEYYSWNGNQFVQGAAAGMSASFAAGTLTLNAPLATLGNPAAFGLLAVSSRNQVRGEVSFIASDFAPNSGRSAFSGTSAPAQFPDASGDHDAAPDIGAVNVSDTPDGWVRFAITTPNYATLSDEKFVFIDFDRDNRAISGDGGAEVALSYSGGEAQLQKRDLKRNRWVNDVAPTRVRTQNAANVVTIDIHRSELDDTPRFGFAITTADYNSAAETLLAIDIAPDDSGGVPFWRYELANKPALRLIPSPLLRAPASPRAGRAFVVKLPVRRTDTSIGITGGRVACAAALAGAKLRAVGSVKDGEARCTMKVPRKAKGKRLAGSVKVTILGKSTTAKFAHVVR
jgi:hypothetical protein